MNKIKFGLKNVHRAPFTVGDDGVVEYGTPVPLKGAVSLTLDADIASTKVPADDLPAFATLIEDSGFTGALEVTYLQDEDRVEMFGSKIDKNGVLVESNSDIAKPQALLFEISGDERKMRHVLYNVLFSKPAAGSQTGKSANQNDSCNLVASPAEDTGEIKAKVENTTKTAETYKNWFNEVYVPVFDGEAAAE